MKINQTIYVVDVQCAFKSEKSPWKVLEPNYIQQP